MSTRRHRSSSPATRTTSRTARAVVFLLACAGAAAPRVNVTRAEAGAVTPTATAATSAAATATPTPAAVTGLDHFQCYETHHGPFTAIPDVTLTDVFGSATRTLGTPKRLCNPASKNGESPAAPSHAAHLVAYKVLSSPPSVPRRDVTVTNQFGALTVDLIRPDLVLVPSAKGEVTPPPPLAGATLDHFQCYAITHARFRASAIGVQDQFGSLTLDIKRPTRLCAPADKNGEGIFDAASSLVCYEVRQPTGVQFRAQRRSLFIDNQFGGDIVDVARPTELCVPSRLTVSGATATPSSTPTAPTVSPTPAITTAPTTSATATPTTTGTVASPTATATVATPTPSTTPTAPTPTPTDTATETSATTPSATATTATTPTASATTAATSTAATATAATPTPIPTVTPAATFLVNSTGDEGLANDAALCADAQSTCTLRAAIERANATDAFDVIAFSIAGSGVHTITPASDLPSITKPVLIDGYTQFGATVNAATTGDNATLLIELDGSNANVSAALTLDGPGSTIQGLVIDNGFSFGIFTTTKATGNVIRGNFIGTDPTGLIARGTDAGAAVDIFGPTNVVGGPDLASRNIISGNFAGVEIFGDGAVSAVGNVVRGNLIGADATGAPTLGNTTFGVIVNMIGADDTTIEGNVIAGNGGQGVVVAAAAGNAILGNSIFQNGKLGIDLDNDGVTQNDAGDGDTGANQLQNFPELTGAVSGNGATVVSGTLNSAGSAPYHIEFFSSPTCNDVAPNDFGEGEVFLGAIDVMTDASGDVGFVPTFPIEVTVGEVVTATATDGAGNTSEFSECEIVIAAP